MSGGYDNSLSTGWTSVEPQLESKASLLRCLAHNFPPQNLPWGVPRHSWVQATVKCSESFGKICSVAFEGCKREEILSQLKKES